MAASRKPRRGNSPVKRLAQQCKGLIIEWEDKDPMSDTEHVVNGSVKHTNPFMRSCASQIWRDIGNTLASQIVMRWIVRLTVVFSYPNGQDQLEERELEAKCILNKLNEIALEQIEDAMRHGAIEHYVTTKFHVECLGA